MRLRTQTIFYFIARNSGKREREQLENRVEEILNGAWLNEVANIDLAVLVGMVENADRDTQSEMIGALMVFIQSYKRFTKK